MTDLPIPAGMVPWSGGDSAPNDWDGGLVLFRVAGLSVTTGPFIWARGSGRHPFDIIAYTPKPIPASGEGLLPCPFCGGAAEVQLDRGRNAVGIGCTKCTTAMVPSWDIASESWARRAWNTRTRPPEPQAAGEGLREAEREIEVLRRALCWLGDPQRMATTREEWQQTVDRAVVWVKSNPEPDRPSFSSFAALSDPFDDCLSVHVEANARRFAALSADATQRGTDHTPAPQHQQVADVTQRGGLEEAS